MTLLRSGLIGLCLILPLMGAEADPPSKGYPSGLQFDLHAAMPLGNLAADVNDQWGFGIGLGYQGRLANRLDFRASFHWTGYRISDRNLGSRVLASIFDAAYEENRLILRSYALGGDFLGYLEADRRGAYLLAGGGIQRSRMYYENRFVDEEGNESLRTIAAWPAADTPYTNFGLGYRGRSGAFLEGRVVLWRYRAEPGVRLTQTSQNAPSQLRDAVSFVTAFGVCF